MAPHDDYEDQDELMDDDDDAGFTLETKLGAPAAKLYKCEELHRMIHEGEIDLNPPYQRDIVWPEPKQIRVLDSIWRNYYVPPVVFTVIHDGEGEIRRCVDGKQRLTSIQKFIDGQVSSHFNMHKHYDTGKSWWYRPGPSTKKGSRQLVPDHWKRDFARKTMTCIEYHGLDETLERDIFQRVQLGMPLTAAEKLQAIHSPWQEWISGLEARFILLEDGLTQTIDVDVARGRDFQLVAQLVFCCEQLPMHAQPSARNLERFLSRKDSPSPELQATVKAALTAFWHIAHSEDLNYPFRDIKKRVAPAEFVFTGVLLYVLRDHTYEEQAEAIYNMRTHIRKKYPDIRMRNDIVRDLWDFVEEILDAEPDPRPSKKKGRKARAREDDDDMDFDDEYRPKKQNKRK
ncbi:hypothetical protein C8Q79DRAFT_1001865 [Trametes meyenii]|nr:hypothetical protein C8Q79DRAFT_1001865 [Trametes meyenii]